MWQQLRVVQIVSRCTIMYTKRDARCFSILNNWFGNLIQRVRVRELESRSYHMNIIVIVVNAIQLVFQSNTQQQNTFSEIMNNKQTAKKSMICSPRESKSNDIVWWLAIKL